jgi:hypothetical protein
MRGLNGRYTRFFNKTRQRMGHVFQGRNKAIIVQKDSYLLELSRYIILNANTRRMSAKRLINLFEIEDRGEAMSAVYKTGHYTMFEIAAYFHIHYSTVSRAIRLHCKIQ